MTFAIITPALIIGAFPERVSFPFLLLFVAGWVLIVSVPVAHWVWGQGWLGASGTIDFARRDCRPHDSGVSALVMALLIGPGRAFPDNLLPPHSPGLTMAGYSKYILCSEAYGMEVVVARWGNSLGLRIPKDIAARAGLREGARVSVGSGGKRIVITPARPHYRLAELLRGITPDAMRDAFDWGRIEAARS
jgi:Amt family ammonium transporter